MAQMGYTVDPTDLPEHSGEYKVADVGDHLARAIEGDVSTLDNGKMQVVWNFEITDGPCAGVKHREWVTIKNPDGYTPPPGGDPAVIGQRLNNQFAAAIGLTTGADDTDNYLFKPVVIYVKAKKPYKKGDGTTVTNGRQIGSFKPATGGKAPVATGNAPSAAGGSVARTSTVTSPSSGGKPKAAKGEDGKWYDEDGNSVPFFKLSGYEKVEG